MDLFGALSLYGPQLGNPLNAQAQAASQLAELGCLCLSGERRMQYANLGQMAWNANEIPRLKREAFLRSCSRNWLNAMLDVELGV